MELENRNRETVAFIPHTGIILTRGSAFASSTSFIYNFTYISSSFAWMSKLAGGGSNPETSGSVFDAAAGACGIMDNGIMC